MSATDQHPQLILVTLDIQAFRSCCIGTATSILTKCCLRVDLAPHQECGLRCRNVLLLASPLLDSALLQRSSEGEGQCPRLQHLELVHCVQILRCLLLALPTRKEHDSRHCRRHRAPQCLYCVLSNHLSSHLWAVRTRGDHVRLQECAFQ